jgi:DNA (cytosine-5)-methyltransferase 1
MLLWEKLGINIFPEVMIMPQQLHLRLDDRVYTNLSNYAIAANKTRQDCVMEALALYITEKTKETKKTDIRFRFIDLFAGIGGMRIAFDAQGGECVFSSEWDKYCQRTYFENFGDMPYGDITKINEHDIPDHEILVAGFPCQPFSIAGVSKKNSLGRATGFLDQAQGTLFFDVVRIINAKRPHAFLLENVKNLKSHDKGKTWKIITNSLDELDYEIFSCALDGQLFTPQHRERIFIAGFDRKRYGNEITFNYDIDPPEKTPKVKDILEAEVEERYTLTNHLWQYLQNYAAKHQAKGNGFGFGLVDLNGITRTLSARYYKDGSEILIPQEGKNPRRLTPRECARLQGYNDDFKIPVSDTQAYKQFGNSVVVPLVSAVAERLVATFEILSEIEFRRFSNG